MMLGNSAQDFYYDSLCFNHYISDVRQLKHFIHVFAPFSLRYDESKSKKKRDNILFYYTMFGDKHNCTIADEIIEKYQIEKKKFDDLFYGITCWKDIRKRLWQYFFERTTWQDETLIDKCFDRNNVPQAEIDMVIAEFNKPYPLTIIENKRIVTQMYEKISAMGVRPLIVFQPLNEVYRKYWKYDHYYENLSFAEELRNRFGCVVLDLTFNTIPDDFFRDILHLNSKGKEYVTKMIADTMKEHDM
jgi:hypothetical protein